ncbi:deoxyribodipyrimidine photo-lyase [Fulvivirgaceae bacterium BMA10]|uniref:Deoxyribodipyrimidine photo-lyase n=1 Tax=Splendidivirga corallicola TaxID=3051826 RepID=A0ABT8KW49_9BACT|nr:deoxyribodipyrimidine photo-lyase [Fulvivirgaceae bacterium BMA10]
MNQTDRDTVIFWFRRDLRLHDNIGLYHALKENNNVLPVFIFDKEILDELEDEQDMRVNFIYKQVIHLKEALENLGSSLLMYHGNPIKFFEALEVAGVYTNHDYEPYAIKRDNQIQALLNEKNIPFKTYKDQVIFEKNEILKEDGEPYTVFTPYSRKWLKKLDSSHQEPYLIQSFYRNFKKIQPVRTLSLSEIGFKAGQYDYPSKQISGKIIEQYETNRDFPALQGTSRLSVHLRFGTISIREAVKEARKYSQKWLSELIWREFYMMILWHFPKVVTSSFNSKYDQLEWRNNEKEFEAWCNGMTGYPIVDAGMRELNATGFMHNRVRMITASFLTKHLLIDWRWGEAYFAKKLLDFELSSNNGGWQWAAGCGCDAAPYFRIFNPYIQTQKFDPKSKYIKKWVPEFQEIQYPPPIVDHQFARNRALETFDALRKEKNTVTT